ncbi:TAXI family TRAP transporter solute-binding subunit [Bacillus sp. Marseille-P3661]|uniref:TAXI family TRAP transporter solute-binding subunit n=1 Tax=Bacillus sp. Marseille-P3661 TaxID=1936234 RepID=UPI000C83D04D|nr:TAXI family TRAP transporter solute-binding subunit [Bacillus sp. Marseille-P3661]
MKKQIWRNLVVGMLILLLIITAGCSSNSSSSSESNSDGSKAEGYSGIVPIYTPGAGGIAYILSAGISQVVNNSGALPNVQLATEATNGSADIMQFVLDKHKEGKPAFGGLAASTVSNLYEGEYGPIEGAHPELRGVGFLSLTALHVVVPADSDIKDFSDLKGKKVAASPGAATTTLLMQLLEEEYGLSESDYTYVPIDYAEIQQGLQNGSIDAGLINGAIPAPLVKETESLTDIRVLSVGKEEMESFLESYPYHGSMTIEAGTYKDQKEDILVPLLLIIYATHEKTDDDIVYNLVKTMLESGDQLVDIHPEAKNINGDTILNGVAVPLHAGAEKYYKEKGIIE